MKKLMLLSFALFAFIYKGASAVQVIDEVKTFLQDSTTQGTPDPNNSFVWPIDLFAENVSPTSNGWQIVSGGAACSAFLIRFQIFISCGSARRVLRPGPSFRAIPTRP